MITDDDLENAVERIKPLLFSFCDEREEYALMAAIILAVGMAKEQRFPMTVFHKMVDEMAESWDANMPSVMRN